VRLLAPLLFIWHEHSHKGSEQSVALWTGIVVLSAVVVVGLLLGAKLLAGLSAGQSRPCPGCGRFYDPKAEPACPFCGAGREGWGEANQEEEDAGVRPG
jgi:hypothetical protein